MKTRADLMKIKEELMDIKAAIKYNNGRPYTPSMWKDIQALIGAGVDGDPGKETARRLAAWQRTNGKGPDGKAGRGTFKAMCKHIGYDYLDAYGLDAIAARHPDHTVVVDMSKWQAHDHRKPQADDQNWDAVAAAGVKGVIVKLSEHERWGDKAAEFSLRGVASVDILRGAYHVAEFIDARDDSVTSPRKEAENFMRRLADVSPAIELPIYLDLEQKLTRAYFERTNSRAVAAWCMDWVRIVESESGLPVRLYISRHSQKMCQPLQDLVDRSLWLVDYHANKDGLWLGTGQAAKGWDAHVGMRQVSEEVNCPGIASSKIDLDLVQGANLEGAALIAAITGST